MKLILIGFLSGIISGMGIGGGTLLIPFLVFFNDLTQLEAQGINLVVFIPVALVAIVTHYKEGNIEFKYSKKIILSGIIPAILGSYLASKIKSNHLGKAFGAFLLIIGLYEFFSNKKPE